MQSADNTFTSPLNPPPELGAVFVVDALTKFINGHGDAQEGAILTNNLETMDRIRYEAHRLTLAPSSAHLIHEDFP